MAWGSISKDGDMKHFGAEVASLSRARKKLRKDVKACKKEAMATQCRAYSHYRKTDVDQWMQDLTNSAEKPTPQQERFIEHVIHQCREEQK